MEGRTPLPSFHQPLLPLPHFSARFSQADFFHFSFPFLCTPRLPHASSTFPSSFSFCDFVTAAAPAM